MPDRDQTEGVERSPAGEGVAQPAFRGVETPGRDAAVARAGGSRHGQDADGAPDPEKHRRLPDLRAVPMEGWLSARVVRALRGHRDPRDAGWLAAPRRDW